MGVGDETPYLVLVRLGGENTITTACQVPVLRKEEVETAWETERETAGDATRDGGTGTR